MRKQYMDFVPAKAQITRKQKTVSATSRSTNVSATRGTEVPSERKRQTARTSVASTEVAKSGGKTAAVGFGSEKKPSLGKVENLNTRFVRSDVPKRPLSRMAHFTTGKAGVAAVKAQKVGVGQNTSVRPVEKPVEKSKITRDTYKTPKSPFINQGRIGKRPLSKNVYPEKKAPVAPKAEPKGPETIISKPEKQAHAGMIVAIILTIILGAAAGTVAFLLLPK